MCFKQDRVTGFQAPTTRTSRGAVLTKTRAPRRGRRAMGAALNFVSRFVEPDRGRHRQIERVLHFNAAPVGKDQMQVFRELVAVGQPAVNKVEFFRKNQEFAVGRFQGDSDDLQKIVKVYKVAADMPTKETSKADKFTDGLEIFRRVAFEHCTINGAGNLHGLLKANIPHIITTAGTNFAISTVRNRNKGNAWNICTRFAVAGGKTDGQAVGAGFNVVFTNCDHGTDTGRNFVGGHRLLA